MSDDRDARGGTRTGTRTLEPDSQPAALVAAVAGRGRRGMRDTARALAQTPGYEHRLRDAEARISSLEARLAVQDALITRLGTNLAEVSALANRLGADSAVWAGC